MIENFLPFRRSIYSVAHSFAETICQGMRDIHEFWAVPIELGLALWLLNRQLGLAFLAPAIVAFISIAGILGIAKYMGNAQKVWIEGIQTRIDVTASMLSSMKVITPRILFTQICTAYTYLSPSKF